MSHQPQFRITPALLAWMILAEGLSLLQALGGVVILCGIGIAGRGSR